MKERRKYMIIKCLTCIHKKKPIKACYSDDKKNCQEYQKEKICHLKNDKCSGYYNGETPCIDCKYWF